MFNVSSEWLLHEGRTKAYESVLILHKMKGVNIRRWGKATPMVNNGGGEVQIKTDGRLHAASLHKAILREKSSRGYTYRDEKLHGALALSNRNGDWPIGSWDDLYAKLKRQYSEDFANQVRDFLDLKITMEPSSIMIDELSAPEVVMPNKKTLEEECAAMNPNWGIF